MLVWNGGSNSFLNRGARVSESPHLASLIDHLTGRLGQQNVVRCALRSDPQPEKAYCRVSLVDQTIRSRKSRSQGNLPGPFDRPAECTSTPDSAPGFRSRFKKQLNTSQFVFTSIAALMKLVNLAVQRESKPVGGEREVFRETITVSRRDQAIDFGCIAKSVMANGFCMAFIELAFTSFFRHARSTHLLETKTAEGR